MNAPRSGVEPIRRLADESPRLLARVRAMLGDSARRACESLDYVQDAWVEFLRAPGAAGEDEDGLVRRFCAIARNNVRDAARRRREPGFESAPALVDPGEIEALASAISSRLARDEFLERFASAVARLPHDLRAVVELRVFDEASFAEVARRLARNEDTVRKAYQRALVLLARELGPQA